MRKTTLAAALALAGFAANSILCRMALGERMIDAWSFTCVRLAAGALTLALLARRAASRDAQSASVSMRSALVSGLALFAYAAAFSLAYLRLPVAVGALVLFACVQVVMIGWGVRKGERPGAFEWIGLVLALGGLVVLAAHGTAAGVSASSDPSGLLLMALAGSAWGIYSIRGRSSRAPLLTTARNFAWSVPPACVGLLLGRSELQLSARGMWLAVASGALASGLGYSLWYFALPSLTARRAALVQLLVPVLAAAAAVMVLGEQVTLRLAIAAAMILCGVGMAVALRGPKPAHNSAGNRGSDRHRR